MAPSSDIPSAVPTFTEGTIISTSAAAEAEESEAAAFPLETEGAAPVTGKVTTLTLI